MNEVPPPDEQLLMRLADADQNAYRLLYQRYKRAVFARAVTAIRDIYDADDVTSLVFLELWRRCSAIRLLNGSALPWLLSTTNFAAKNVLRTRMRQERLLRRMPPRRASLRSSRNKPKKQRISFYLPNYATHLQCFRLQIPRLLSCVWCGK